MNRPVPVNLLMAAILLAGLSSALTLRRQFFPEVAPESASVTLPYPGAAPREIEDTLAIKVEDKLADLTDYVDEQITILAEGGGGITVRFREGVDPDQAMDEIDRAIDELQDLPAESEEITAKLLEPRLPVVRLALYGDLAESVKKDAIRRVRDDLLSLPGMGEVLVEGARDYEVRVDVRGAALARYGLSLPRIADRIASAMRDVPGGTVRGRTGNVKIRTLGVAERAEAIRQIELLSDERGRSIRLGEIATVREAFVDNDIQTRFQGQPAAFLTVFKVGRQDIVKIAQRVRAYVAGRSGAAFTPTLFERLGLALPAGVRAMVPMPRLTAYELGRDGSNPLPVGATLVTHSDLARYVEGRLDLLTRNAVYGAVLVFASLLLFLNWRVALWVGIGLVTAMLGTLVLMAWADITLNLLTMFGLIVVLGLLVDDAIVVSENIQRRHDQGEASLAAAENGTVQVFWPVVATVMTSIVAFLPLTFIKGSIGDLLGALPWVVACALVMSLIESLMILPSHMGHSLIKRDRHRPGRVSLAMRRFETWRDGLILDRFVPLYGRVLGGLLDRRYAALAVAVSVLIVSLGMLAGGRVGFTFLPSSDSETIMVDIKMPTGTALVRTEQTAEVIESVVSDQPETKSIATVIGTRSNIDTGQNEGAAAHVAQMFIELKPVEQRDRASSRVIQSVRQGLAGKIGAVESINFSEITGGPGGADIQLKISGPRIDELQAAAADIKALLAGYAGVFDIADDDDQGQLELQFELTASGQALGFTRADIAQQVRATLFGIDAHVFADRREDIDVRVRLDGPTRRSLFAVEHLWLISPAGVPVPLGEIVTVTEASAYATIKRIDRQRAITITAATAPGLSPEDVTRALATPPPRKPPEAPGSFPLRDRPPEAGPPRKLAPRDRPEGGSSAPGDISFAVGPGAASLLSGDSLPGSLLPGSSPGVSPLDALRARHPGVTIAFGGRQEQMGEAFASLPMGFAAAVVMIYIILAVLFSKYLQPLVVLLVVPFAVIGVVWGHFFLGYTMTFLSLIGFVALTGIVVNDSLILVQFFNEQQAEGHDIRTSIIRAGRARVRAILLTTITTVLGLLPLILEQSFQAKFLIPMAISIAGGLIAATGIVLIVLPCSILIFDDLKRFAHHLWYGKPPPEAFPRATGV